MKLTLPGDIVVEGDPAEIMTFCALQTLVSEFEETLRREFAAYLMRPYVEPSIVH